MRRIIALAISFCLIFEQTGFAQVAGQMQIPGYLASLLPADNFSPVQLRSVVYNPTQENFRLMLDQGDVKAPPKQLDSQARVLWNYFLVGLRLPNSMFWVNLRPDAPTDIIDPSLEKTDLGKILLAADLQLKKDMARLTSPDTTDGKRYWARLYAKAEQIYGQADMEIPTITRPWIVPGEVIIKETGAGAYIYKAALNVMLEQDYIKNSPFYNFSDPKQKEMNAYSSELIRSIVLPRLVREINSSKRYAELRQVFYSVVLAQWVKQRLQGQQNALVAKIDSKDLTGLTSATAWSKDSYYNAYKKSFSEGEFNKEETITTGSGLVVRNYFSGGAVLAPTGAENTWYRLVGSAIDHQSSVAFEGRLNSAVVHALEPETTDNTSTNIAEDKPINLSEFMESMTAYFSANRDRYRATLKDYGLATMLPLSEANDIEIRKHVQSLAGSKGYTIALSPAETQDKIDLMVADIVAGNRRALLTDIGIEELIKYGIVTDGGRGKNAILLPDGMTAAVNAKKLMAYYLQRLAENVQREIKTGTSKEKTPILNIVTRYYAPYLDEKVRKPSNVDPYKYFYGVPKKALNSTLLKMFTQVNNKLLNPKVFLYAVAGELLRKIGTELAVDYFQYDQEVINDVGSLEKQDIAGLKKFGEQVAEHIINKQVTVETRAVSEDEVEYILIINSPRSGPSVEIARIRKTADGITIMPQRQDKRGVARDVLSIFSQSMEEVIGFTDGGITNVRRESIRDFLSTAPENIRAVLIFKLTTPDGEPARYGGMVIRQGRLDQGAIRDFIERFNNTFGTAQLQKDLVRLPSVKILAGADLDDKESFRKAINALIAAPASTREAQELMRAFGLRSDAAELNETTPFASEESLEVLARRGKVSEVEAPLDQEIGKIAALVDAEKVIKSKPDKDEFLRRLNADRDAVGRIIGESKGDENIRDAANMPQGDVFERLRNERLDPRKFSPFSGNPVVSLNDLREEDQSKIVPETTLKEAIAQPEASPFKIFKNPVVMAKNEIPAPVQEEIRSKLFQQQWELRRKSIAETVYGKLKDKEFGVIEAHKQFADALTEAFKTNDIPLTQERENEILAFFKYDVDTKKWQFTDGGSTRGGIDFRAVPMITQHGMGIGMPAIDMKQLQLLAAKSTIADLDKEWINIQKQIKGKQMPYARMKEYIAVCCQRKAGDKHMNDVMACLTSVLKLEEKCAVATSPEMKELLVIIETTRMG